MRRRFLDTNILMRYFTRDDEQKAAAALALLRRIKAGTEQVTTSLRSSPMVFMIEGLEKPIPIEDLHYEAYSELHRQDR